MLIFSTKPNQTRFWVMGKQSFLVLKDGPAATIGGKNIDRNYSELIKREGKRTKLCFEINQGEPFRTVPATVPCSQWCRKELSSGLNLLYQ
ncbi:hypothetical protein QQP08_022191 [Theobroma cacao]|nr:hypothetical protein QQP08_022191 [Theobroma cacao]